MNRSLVQLFGHDQSLTCRIAKKKKKKEKANRRSRSLIRQLTGFWSTLASKNWINTASPSGIASSWIGVKKPTVWRPDHIVRVDMHPCSAYEVDRSPSGVFCSWTSPLLRVFITSAWLLTRHRSRDADISTKKLFIIEKYWGCNFLVRLSSANAGRLLTCTADVGLYIVRGFWKKKNISSWKLWHTWVFFLHFLIWIYLWIMGCYPFKVIMKTGINSGAPKNNSINWKFCD